MSSQHQTTADGVVLATHPSGDHDLMVTCLTHPGGLTSALRKGGRSQKKGKARLEPFDSGRFTFRNYPSGLKVIADFSHGELFPRIREEFSKLALGALLLEIVHRLVPEEEQESERLLAVLLKTLRGLNLSFDTKESLKVIHLGIFDLLKILGYIDSSPMFSPPSRDTFHRLIQVVEQQIHRPLATREEVLRLLESLS